MKNTFVKTITSGLPFSFKNFEHSSFINVLKNALEKVGFVLTRLSLL